MLKRLFSWFFQPRETAGSELFIDPDTIHSLRTISHDKDLISVLKHDHADLVRDFTAISNAAAARKYRDLPKMLSEFRTALTEHVAKENVKFYAFVQQHYANDADKTAHLKVVRKQMDDIGRAVSKFTNRYESEVLDDVSVQQFMKDLEGIGQALVARVQMEEGELYTLYPDAVPA